jgi:hypothetical protein
MTLTFRDLLMCADIDPASTRLARHQDPRSVTGETLFELWINDRPKFEAYQRVQARKKFHNAEHLAAFVVTPESDTLFVGVYSIQGCEGTPKERICPVSEVQKPLYEYALSPSHALSEYRARITIEWAGPRSWCQRADGTPKRVTQILRESYGYAPFPGFHAFSVDRSRFDSVPLAWREVLRSSSGVYLLVHPETGEQYVGSAYGDRGFLGRFETYACDGHGGNVLLKPLRDADWRMSVLEVASSNSDDRAIIARETHWKKKLGTRSHSLNAN